MYDRVNDEKLKNNISDFDIFYSILDIDKDDKISQEELRPLHLYYIKWKFIFKRGPTYLI